MTVRNLLILERKNSQWFSFFEEFFEDTPSKLHFCHEAAEAGLCLDRVRHDIVFVNPELLSLALTQKIEVFRHSDSHFRAFRIGAEKGEIRAPVFDGFFDKIVSFSDFQKKLLEQLPLPETIRVLIVDDEPEIAFTIREFLERRVSPAFEVDYASDGAKGLEAIGCRKPDVLVLDIKMPVKDGREVYREMREKGLNIPVIILFDAISGDEMVEIHRIGKPAVVEKGSHQSTLPELTSLIKKMAYFG